MVYTRVCCTLLSESLSTTGHEFVKGKISQEGLLAIDITALFNIINLKERAVKRAYWPLTSLSFEHDNLTWKHITLLEFEYTKGYM